MRRVVGSIAACLVLVGCADFDVGDEHELDDLEAAEAAAITPNRLLRNDEVIGASRATRAQVQALLDHYDSALADYRDGGRLAARLIHDAAVASDISPVYLVARIETESGLIRSGTLRNIDKATGCGCPDSVPCDPAHAGFGLQVRCAAEKMRGYLSSLETRGQTVSGWKVGRGKSTLDPCWVVPANAVTAALYTYTPWVGAYAQGCGTSRWGGSSLAALLTRKFQVDLEALDPVEPPPAGDWLVVDSDDARNDAAVARVEMSAAWTATSATAGYYGTGYAFASVQAVSDPAVFWFYLEDDGARDLEARWTAGGNRASSAPYIIEDGDGNRVATVRVDQRTDGGRWVGLGRHRLTAGWNRVMLSRWTSGGDVVIADAVRVR